MPAPGYAELHCLSNFSFQRGASHPEELVARAHALGYAALAITDECSVAGVVRAHTEAKKLGLKLLLGAEFAMEDGCVLIALAHDLQGWGNLCEFITQARCAAPKGKYRVAWQTSPWALLQDCELLLGFCAKFSIAIDLEAYCQRITLSSALVSPNSGLRQSLAGDG